MQQKKSFTLHPNTLLVFEYIRMSPSKYPNELSKYLFQLYKITQLRTYIPMHIMDVKSHNYIGQEMFD